MARDEHNICLRISDDVKDMLKNAARASGKSLSSFVRDAALDEAERQRDERLRRYEQGDLGQ